MVSPLRFWTVWTSLCLRATQLFFSTLLWQEVNSLRRLKRNFVRDGHSEKNISSRVFGYSANLIAAKYSRNQHNLVAQIEVADFLEVDMILKPDVIIGNPPFQNPNSKSSSGKLWGKFVEKSFDIVNDGGTVALITPNSWTKGEVSPQGNGKLLKLLADNNTNYITNGDVGKYFPNVGVTFSYFITEKRGNEGTCLLTQNGRAVRV